jgi:dipeptidyl aminopeptidase/acylaminoacyl peptidase
LTVLVSSYALAMLALPIAAQAAFPGANGKIAFETQRDRVGSTNIWEIYSTNPDGSQQTNLTNDPASDLNPAWSADGQRLAFASDRTDWPSAFEIYIVNTDGSGLRQLTFNREVSSDPTWSPDGQKIAYQDGGIHVINALDGSQDVEIADGQHPAWSPDGQRIVYIREECADPGCEYFRDDLWLMNSDGSDQMLVRQNAAAPSWSPDGQKFTLELCLPTCGIYVMNTDGTGVTQLTSSGHDPVWSPDGKQIAYDDDSTGQLRVMNADGSNQHTVSSTYDTGPDWQPLPAASYAHPESASPLSVSLVPLFRQCGDGGDAGERPPLGTARDWLLQSPFA